VDLTWLVLELEDRRQIPANPLPSMTTYSVSHAAYLKLILHAAKYPHKVVNGGKVFRH